MSVEKKIHIDKMSVWYVLTFTTETQAERYQEQTTVNSRNENTYRSIAGVTLRDRYETREGAKFKT